MPCWVYLLTCHKNGKFTNFYTGYTHNLRSRVGTHINNVRNKNTIRYTGRFDFVRLVWKRRCITKEEALQLEQDIKPLSQDIKWALVKGAKVWNKKV